MPVEFGLSQKDISDKQFLYLLKKGNPSAKILLLEKKGPGPGPGPPP